MLEWFNSLHTNDSLKKFPEIVSKSPISLFYKRRIGDKVLYTKVENGTVNSFESQDFNILHTNQNYELQYVLHGELTNVIEDKKYHYRAGEGCLLNPKIKHCELLEEECSILFLNFSHSLLIDLLKPYEDSGPIFRFLTKNIQTEKKWHRNYLEFIPALPHPNHTFQMLLDSIQVEIGSHQIGYSHFQKGLSLRLLSALQNEKRFIIKQIDLDVSNENHLVNRLTHEIEGRFGAISRKEIEKSLHYNADYLNRLLKKSTGKTITEYSQMIRIQKAQQLLTTTSFTIQQIADQLGFANETYLYHFFKKKVGLSPNQYRKLFF